MGHTAAAWHTPQKATPQPLCSAGPGWADRKRATFSGEGASSRSLPPAKASEIVILFGLARRTARKSRKYHYSTVFWMRCSREIQASPITVVQQTPGLLALRNDNLSQPKPSGLTGAWSAVHGLGRRPELLKHSPVLIARRRHFQQAFLRYLLARIFELPVRWKGLDIHQRGRGPAPPRPDHNDNALSQSALGSGNEQPSRTTKAW